MKNDNAKKFNLPAYVQTPLFLYQDDRLEKPATTIASFFYSLHTGGKEFNRGTDYLCALANIKRRYLSVILNQLEELKYIKRIGFTSKRQIKWIFSPESKILIQENEPSAPECPSDEKLPTRALENPKLGHCSALNYGTAVHTNIIDNIIGNIINPSCAFPSESTVNAFDSFWSLYPSKKAKKKCQEIWKRRKLDSIADEIVEKLKNQVANDEQWARGFAPNPSTYLNGDRWNDELSASSEKMANEKRIQLQLDNKIREAQQERLSQQRLADEQDRHQQFNKDGIAFRAITKEVARQSDVVIPQGFRELKQSLGIK